jgi:dolichol-phosphate mannosyltransferase
LAGLSILFTAGVLAAWACGVVQMSGWMWAGLAFLGLWNVQFLCLAVLGEYIVRTHRHTQRRPLYVVEAVIESGRVLTANGRGELCLAPSQRLATPAAVEA